MRFHTVYWPAFLLAAGLETPQARLRAWLAGLVEGQKMSKSLGNVIAPDHLVATYGIDARRAISCMREVPFGQRRRASRTRRSFTGSNGDLANDLGNLAQPLAVDDQQRIAATRFPSMRAFDRRRTRRCSARSTWASRPRARGVRRAALDPQGAGSDLVRLSATPTAISTSQAPWTLKKTDHGADGDRALCRWPRRSAISRSWCSRWCRSPPRRCWTSLRLDRISAASRRSDPSRPR